MTEQLQPQDVRRVARQLFPDGGLGSRIQCLRPRIAPFHLLLPLVPVGAAVLDVGCGSGLFLGLLTATGRLGRGVGFDANAAAVALAERMRSRLPADGAARVRFDQVDVANPWPEGVFDVVSVIDVLHHIPPRYQPQVLATAYARTAPGGILLYKDMATHPTWCALANRLHDLVMARQWIRYLPLQTAEKWLTDAGAIAEQAGACRMLWYSHEFVVFRKPPLLVHDPQVPR